MACCLLTRLDAGLGRLNVERQLERERAEWEKERSGHAELVELLMTDASAWKDALTTLQNMVRRGSC
jgi:hypothetical protein